MSEPENITDEEFEKDWEESSNIHKLWHKFGDYMSKWYFNMVDEWDGKDGEVFKTGKKVKEVDLKHLAGYEVIERVEKFSADNPDMKTIGCDDDHFASSRIALVPHETDDKYMGTTIMFIPQCTKTSNIMFLYPNHLDNLIKELQDIQKRQREKADEFYEWDD